ncbi:MAG TPA: sigma 54-interacting transcriptional regulator [Kofleriaceae bacterium]
MTEGTATGTQVRPLLEPGQIVVGLRALDGTEYPLGTQPRVLVGSHEACDIVVVDRFVSGTHCVLERGPYGVLVVRDRKSRNGTRVDGTLVEGTELRIGSRLTIGQTTLVAFGPPGAVPATARDTLRGGDPALRAELERASRAAITDCNVLVVGETGTGKDLFARAIHEGSRRASGPFVAVNCGGIPRELIGSELFGHEKGAFTGATTERDGYFVQAHGGTLFLDEIAELPLELQPHLLRALETRRVRRVGGSSERAVDVRIVAATNRVLLAGGEGSSLRSDIYHRLATVVLSLPPLRGRKGDLPELVDALLAELAPVHGRRQVSDAAWAAIGSYAWPGNVRELRHAVARAVVLGGPMLGTQDFFPAPAAHSSPPVWLAADGPGGGLASRGGDVGPHRQPGTPSPVLRHQAKLRNDMEQALEHHGSLRAAADALGMPKSTFADRAHAWGLVPPGRAKWRRIHRTDEE